MQGAPDRALRGSVGFWAPPRPLEERAHARARSKCPPARARRVWKLAPQLGASFFVQDRRWLWPPRQQDTVVSFSFIAAFQVPGWGYLRRYSKAFEQAVKLSRTQRAERCAAASSCHRLTNVQRLLHKVSVFVLRSLNFSGCCVAVSQVRTRCLTVRCKSLLREDKCGNSRGVCLKTILVSQVRIRWSQSRRNPAEAWVCELKTRSSRLISLHE